MTAQKRQVGAGWTIVLPGLLVAATGIGAGDLATAAFAGSHLGMAVLWAVVAGAAVKFTLNEGLTRWQLATDETILEGAIRRFGPVLSIVFLLYLLPWSFFVGAALMSACGATAYAMWPIVDDPQQGKLIFAVAHSAVAVALVLAGGFKLFERLMAGCIGVMFITVVVTAVLRRPDLGDVARGLVVPRIPDADGSGIGWTVALMGGVGGTLTIICYGYWIREAGRTGMQWLRTCRIDLATAYVVTALFGLAMVVIAAGLSLDGSGVGLIVALSKQLEASMGPAGRWIFLIGAWAAVFSSLLGVWQAVPYIFADFVRVNRRGHTDGTAGHALAHRLSYRIFLVCLAVIPLLQISRPFREVQKVYAVMGAAFIPLLALGLLIMNGRRDWVGDRNRNRPWTMAVLIATIVFFVLAGYFDLRKRFG